MTLRRIICAVVVSSLFGIFVGHAPAERLYAITPLKILITFDSASPGTPLGSVNLHGFVSQSEEVIGCDFRPANRVLYAVTLSNIDVGRLYTINLDNGQATLVSIISVQLSGSFFGMDFDPVADRIRLISDTKQNLLINPDTAVAIAQGELAYAPGDPSANSFPAVFSCAYTNNYPGAQSSSLYGLDVGPDNLVLIGAPASGTMNTVGSLGIDPGGMNGFDIAGPDNRAYAALLIGGFTRLYRINLATGAAMDLGQISNGDALAGFTAAPPPVSTIKHVQKVRIASAGTGYQELVFNYTTNALFVSPYNNVSGTVEYPLPLDQWVGIFHYDYAAAAYTQAVYTVKLPL